MDCSRTSVRQGAERGHARLPPRHEGHAGVERGPRGDRGRRHRHLPGRPDPGHHRRRRATSPASSSSGWRSARPTPPAGAARSRRPGTEFTIPCDRVLLAIGQGPDLTWIGPGSEGPEATKQHRLKADAVTFETGRPGRLRDRRRADRRRDRRPGHRRGPPLGLRGRRLPQGPRPLGHPDPPDARRAAARVPVDRAVHAARSRSRATG